MCARSGGLVVRVKSIHLDTHRAPASSLVRGTRHGPAVQVQRRHRTRGTTRRASRRPEVFYRDAREESAAFSGAALDTLWLDTLWLRRAAWTVTFLLAARRRVVEKALTWLCSAATTQLRGPTSVGPRRVRGGVEQLGGE